MKQWNIGLSISLVGSALLLLPLAASAQLKTDDCLSKFWHGSCRSKSTPTPAPNASSGASDSGDGKGEVVFGVANESSVGSRTLRGDFTYSVEGTRNFDNGTSLEAAYARLHEKGNPREMTDEAKLTFHGTERPLFGQSLEPALALWQDRTMDFVAKMAGVEATHTAATSVSGGMYAGRGSVPDASGRFIAVHGEVSRKLGPLELTLGHTAGAIRTAGDRSRLGEGRFEKTELEGAIDLQNIHATKFLPVAVTVTGARRSYFFGNGGPVGDPGDRYVIQTGAEVNAGDALSEVKSLFGRKAN